jgi:hypothetical protein
MMIQASSVNETSATNQENVNNNNETIDNLNDTNTSPNNTNNNSGSNPTLGANNLNKWTNNLANSRQSSQHQQAPQIDDLSPAAADQNAHTVNALAQTDETAAAAASVEAADSNSNTNNSNGDEANMSKGPSETGERLKMLENEGNNSDDDMRTINYSAVASQRVSVDVVNNGDKATVDANVNNDADDEDGDGTAAKQRRKSKSKVSKRGQTASPGPLPENHPGEQKAPAVAAGAKPSFDASKKQYAIEYPFKIIEHHTELNNRFYGVCKVCILFLLNLVVFVPLVLVCVLVSWPVHLMQSALFKFANFCHMTASSYLSPNKSPEFLTPIELFWLYNSNLNKVCSICLFCSVVLHYIQCC